MLINSLSALFTFTNFINPFEASVILLITFYIVYISTYKNKTFAGDVSYQLDNSWKQQSSLYMYLLSAWLGKQPLLRTFLPFFIIFNLVLLYVDYRAANGTYTIASWFTILIIFALPVIWWTVAVWRCSIYKHRMWAVVARFVTITIYYEYLLRFIIVYYYPQALFNCQQITIEFGDCL